MNVVRIVGGALVWLATVPTPTTDARYGADLRPAATQDVVRLATKPSHNEIVLTRTFSARRAAVFAAMTQPEHLLEWMKSANMALVACDVDLRVGGTFRYVFQRSSGTKIEVRGAYKAVDAPRQWAYTETYNFSPLKIEVTTVLDASGANTVFRQTLRYGSEEERDGDFDGVATSSAEAYDKLDRYLAARR